MRFTPVLVAAIAIIFCMRNTHALTTPPNSQQTMALCTAEAGFLGISGLPKSKVFSPTKQIAFWNVLTGIIRLQDILNDMREQVADPSYFRSRHLDGLSRILYQVLDNACDWMENTVTGYRCGEEANRDMKAKLMLWDNLEKNVPRFKNYMLSTSCPR